MSCYSPTTVLKDNDSYLQHDHCHRYRHHNHHGSHRHGRYLDQHYITNNKDYTTYYKTKYAYSEGSKRKYKKIGIILLKNQRNNTFIRNCNFSLLVAIDGFGLPL